MSADIICVDFRAKKRQTPTIEQQAADILHQAMFGAPLYASADLEFAPIVSPHDKDPA